MVQTTAQTGSQHRLVSPAFRPAAGYLLEGPPRLPRGVELVLVEDSDVGPILTHPADAVVGHSIRVNKTWEPGEGRFLQAHLRPGMNVIDVGAYIGYFTLFLARAVGPEGRILAVEAEPEAFGILRANIELASLSNVDLLPVAAHRAPGLVTMAGIPSNPGSSTAVTLGSGWPMSTVQAVRLDDVLDPELPIDFIKIDVEGMDHTVVQGLERTIRRWQPLMLVEFNPGWIDKFRERPEDVLRLYRELGLEVRLLGGDLIRLHRDGAMSLDDLLLANLVVTEQIDDELIARTRRIHFVNLILTPIENPVIRRRLHDTTS